MVFKVFWKSISQCQHIMEGGGNECFVLSFARFLMSSASDWAARFRLLPLSLQTAPLSGSPKLSFVILNEWCVSAYPNNKAQSRIKGWSAVSYLPTCEDWPNGCRRSFQKRSIHLQTVCERPYHSEMCKAQSYSFIWKQRKKLSLNK